MHLCRSRESGDPYAVRPRLVTDASTKTEETGYGSPPSRGRRRERRRASMNDAIAPWVGHAATRIEDAKLLRGKGRFVDDIHMPELLHATFVRSPVAHARLNSIDAAAAQQKPGVRA